MYPREFLLFCIRRGLYHFVSEGVVVKLYPKEFSVNFCPKEFPSISVRRSFCPNLSSVRTSAPAEPFLSEGEEHLWNPKVESEDGDRTMGSKPWNPKVESEDGVRTMASEPWNPKVESEDGVRTMEPEGGLRRRSPKEESEGGVRGCLRQVLHLSGRPNLGDLHASSGLHQQCDVSIYKYCLHSGVASSQHVRLVFPCPVVFLRFEMFGLGLPLFISSCSVRKFRPGTRWNRARHAMFSTVNFY